MNDPHSSPQESKVVGQPAVDDGPERGEADTTEEVATPHAETDGSVDGEPALNLEQDGTPDRDQERQEESLDLTALAEADPRTEAELLGALLEAEASRDEYLDDLRRARAEFDNYRRRVMRESTTQRDAGKAEAVRGLLEVLDDLDRTLSAAQESEDRSLAKGVELVASKLVQALEALGLSRIDQVDVPFDPTQHEAVQQQPSDEPSEAPTVVQVLRPGYRLGDERILRPAMVVVKE